MFASELLAMTVPISLLGSAKQLLREGGVSGNVLWDILDQMARKMVLDFSRGSRLEATGPLAECPSRSGSLILELLRPNSTIDCFDASTASRQFSARCSASIAGRPH